jgi:hypothetical protein
MVVTQSFSESKIDYFLRRSLTYDVTFDPATGRTRATAEVTLTNEAPPSGLSPVILGEVGGPTAPGVAECLLTILTPLDVVGAQDIGDAPMPLTLGSERGLTTAAAFVSVQPGSSTTVRFELDGVLATSPRYELRVGRQPAAFPDAVDVRIAPADGWVIDDAPRTETITLRATTFLSAHFSHN